MNESDNMTTKKPALASVSGYFDRLREEGLAEERANKGYVWTIRINGTSSINMALASCDYTLDLNCSHVGETAFGVYRGSLSMKFHGNVAGTKVLLALMGIRSGGDLDGWFRNDDFVMKLKPYSKTDEDEFIATFNVAETYTPEATGDPAKDAAAQAGADLANNLVNAILGGIGSAQKAKAEELTSEAAPAGLWYDWDFHMTEGDMGTYFKMNGGPLLWFVKADAGTDSKYSHVEGSANVKTILGISASERYDEPIDSPFPYTVLVFPNGRAMFTLYNYKGGPVTVVWTGTVDRIPVSETTVVKSE